MDNGLTLVAAHGICLNRYTTEAKVKTRQTIEVKVRAIKLTKPGGLDNLKLADIEVAEPQCGEIRIRNHAS